MKRKKTRSEQLAAQNAKANRKHRRELADTAALQHAIARGEITAGEALRAKAKISTRQIIDNAARGV